MTGRVQKRGTVTEAIADGDDVEPPARRRSLGELRHEDLERNMERSWGKFVDQRTVTNQLTVEYTMIIHEQGID